MAYRMFITDIDDSDFDIFKTELSERSRLSKIFGRNEPKLKTTQSFSTSSFILTKFDAIGNFTENINKVLTGGDTISEIFWHPILPPRILNSSKVRELCKQILSDWSLMEENKHELTADSFWQYELGGIIDALKYCSEHNRGMLIFTEKPHDKKRANKTRWPKIVRVEN